MEWQWDGKIPSRFIHQETWMKTKSIYVKICWHHMLTHVSARGRFVPVVISYNTRNNNNNSCWMFCGCLATCTPRNENDVNFRTDADFREFWWKSIHLIGSVILHEIKKSSTQFRISEVSPPSKSTNAAQKWFAEIEWIDLFNKWRYDEVARSFFFFFFFSPILHRGPVATFYICWSGKK